VVIEAFADDRGNTGLDRARTPAKLLCRRECKEGPRTELTDPANSCPSSRRGYRRRVVALLPDRVAILADA
jgi:hypothetical protein